MRFTYENVVSNYVRRFQTRVRRRKIGRNRILYNFYGSLCLRIKGPTYSFRGGGLSWPSAGTVLKQNSKNVFRVMRFDSMTLFSLDFPLKLFQVFAGYALCRMFFSPA